MKVYYDKDSNLDVIKEKKITWTCGRDFITNKTTRYTTGLPEQSLETSKVWM